MNRIYYLIGLVGIAFLILGCNSASNEAKCENPITIPENVKLIGHKGSGPIEMNAPKIWYENGRPSIMNALRRTDGTEIDIQMSKDSTLWLFHDHEIKNCYGDLINFNDLSDIEIESINKCKFQNQLLSLKGFNSILSNEHFENKTISLDLKTLSNPIVLKKWSIDTLLSYVFNKIKKVIDLEHVLLEIPSNIELQKAKSMTTQKVYQVHYEISSIPEEVNNISMPFNFSNSYSKKNLQVWTPNKMSDLIIALSSNPEIIQSDNIDLISYFTELRDGKQVECSYIRPIDIKAKAEQEFIELVKSPKSDEDSFFQLKLDANKCIEGQYLVLSVKDKSGDELFYEAVNIWEAPGYLFLNSSIDNNDDLQYSIYIWNKAKSPLNLKGQLIHFK